MADEFNSKDQPASSAAGVESGGAPTHADTNNLSEEMNNDDSRYSRGLLILELDSKGYTQAIIAKKLGISQATVSRDLKHTVESIYRDKDAFAERMYYEQEKNAVGLAAVQKELWSILNDPQTGGDFKLKVLSQLANTYGRTTQAINTRRNVRMWVREARMQMSSREPSELQKMLDGSLVSTPSKKVKRAPLRDSFEWLQGNSVA